MKSRLLYLLKKMLLILGHQATISSVWWPIGFLWFRSGPQKLARATCFYQFYFRVKTLVKMETSEPSDTCELKTPDTSNCDSNCEKESLAHSGKRIQRKRIFLSQPVKSAFQTEIYLPPSKVNKYLGRLIQKAMLMLFSKWCIKLF